MIVDGDWYCSNDTGIGFWNYKQHTILHVSKLRIQLYRWDQKPRQNWMDLPTGYSLEEAKAMAVLIFAVSGRDDKWHVYKKE